MEDHRPYHRPAGEFLDCRAARFCFCAKVEQKLEIVNAVKEKSLSKGGLLTIEEFREIAEKVISG